MNNTSIAGLKSLSLWGQPAGNRCCHTGENVPASRKVVFVACFSKMLKIGAQVIFSFLSDPATLFLQRSEAADIKFSLPQFRSAWYNNAVNAPAIRKVAERPSAVTRRSRVRPTASSQIGSQVTPLRLSILFFDLSRAVMIKLLPIQFFRLLSNFYNFYLQYEYAEIAVIVGIANRQWRGKLWN